MKTMTGTLLVLFSSVASITLAQTTGSTPPSRGSPPSTTPTEEVIVTAQRRNENIQKVPLSVSSFSAEVLKESGVTLTSDLPNVVPGLQISTGVGLGTPYLRGIGSNTNGPGFENPVAVYVDGVYIPSKAGALENFADVSRVEVLKGPQGTLFGRNATGGLIQLITSDPGPTPTGMVKVGYGNLNTPSGSFYVSAPLTDTLGATLSGYADDQKDGFGRNLDGGKAANRAKDVGLRGKVVFKPTTSTKVTLALDDSRTASDIGVDYRSANGLPGITGFPTPGGKYDIDDDVTPHTLARSYGGSLSIEQKVGDLTFKSITALRAAGYDIFLDDDSSPAPLLKAVDNEHEHSVSQEFQLSGDESDLHWTTGAYIFSSTGAQYLHLSGVFIPGVNSDTTFGAQQVQSYAVYGQATKTIFEATRLTLGARYTFEDRQSDSSTILDEIGGAVATLPNANQSTSFKAPTWRIAIDHDFTTNILGYISWNRGFKSGGFNPFSPNDPPVKPEHIDAYEVGLKSTLFDRRLKFDLAAFYYDYRNIQLTTYVDSIAMTRNAASARIYGLDADFNLKVTDDFHLFGGAEYLHSTFTDYPNAPVAIPIPTGGNDVVIGDATGNYLPFAPKWTANITADYRHTFSLGDAGASLTYSYNGGYFSEVDNYLHQPTYTVINARMTWTPMKWPVTFEVWGKNLGNTFYTTDLLASALGTGQAPAPGRTYGGDITYRF